MVSFDARYKDTGMGVGWQGVVPRKCTKMARTAFKCARFPGGKMPPVPQDSAMDQVFFALDEISLESFI